MEKSHGPIRRKENTMNLFHLLCSLDPDLVVAACRELFPEPEDKPTGWQTTEAYRAVLDRMNAELMEASILPEPVHISVVYEKSHRPNVPDYLNVVGKDPSGDPPDETYALDFLPWSRLAMMEVVDNTPAGLSPEALAACVYEELVFHGWPEDRAEREAEVDAALRDVLASLGKDPTQ